MFHLFSSVLAGIKKTVALVSVVVFSFSSVIGKSILIYIKARSLPVWGVFWGGYLGDFN